MTNKKIIEYCNICLNRGDAECDAEHEDFLMSIIRLANTRTKQEKKEQLAMTKVLVEQYIAEVREKHAMELTTTAFKGWLETFNTESATTCFEAVQKLKQRVKEMQESKEEE